MQPELHLLVWSVALAFAQMLIAAAATVLQVGPVKAAGNRDNLPAITGWGGRAHRAHRNMLENLLLFAALVAVAVIENKTNAMTLLGAQIFFWGRLVYALVYLYGLPWLRSAVWLIAALGLVLIFAQLI